MVDERLVGNIKVGDKLTLLPHRLLSLGEGKIAAVSERSRGWCVASVNDYLYMKDLFKSNEVIFDDSLDSKKSDLIRLLWNSDLLEKNGLCLSKLPQPFMPVLLVLKITGGCNFNCSYCYDYSASRVSSCIPIDRVKNTISSILSKKRGINLVFHGGEPLLYFSLVKEIVEYATNETRDSGYVKFFIQTNGSLFNNEIIDFLAKYNISVGLSLDGMTESANGYRAVKNGASCLEIFNNNLKEYGEFLKKHSGVICTLSKINIKEIPAFVLWLQDLGIKAVVLNVMSSAGKGMEINNDRISSVEFIELFQVLISMVKNKKLENISIENINKFVSSLVNLWPNDVCYSSPCGAGDGFLVIDAEGNYRACDCIYDDHFLLNNHDLGQAISDRSKILSRMEHMKNTLCANCAIFGLCGGGCISEALADNGTDRALPRMSCNIKKYFYKLLLKEYACDKSLPLFSYCSRRGVGNRFNN